jgi:hypothetical protein
MLRAKGGLKGRFIATMQLISIIHCIKTLLQRRREAISYIGRLLLLAYTIGIMEMMYASFPFRSHQIVQYNQLSPEGL